MDLDTNYKNFRSSSAHTSHLTEFSADYISLNTSGPYRHSIRALLLCNGCNNSKSCICNNLSNIGNCFEGENKANDSTCTSKYFRDNESEFSNKSSNLFLRNVPNLKARFGANAIEMEHYTSKSEVSCPLERAQSTCSITRPAMYKCEPKKLTVFTENNKIRMKNRHTYQKANLSNEGSTEINIKERNCAEKTTYCRPNLKEEITERNAKLKCLVKKIIEAREVEKETEAWNNYINELKNKHRYTDRYDDEVTDRQKLYIAVEDVNNEMMSNYYVTRLATNQSSSKNMFRDNCRPCSSQKPRSVHRSSVKLGFTNTNNEIYGNDICSYPISSQGRLTMLQKERGKQRHSSGYQCCHSTSRNMIMADININHPSKRTKRQPSLEKNNKTLFHDISVQTSSSDIKDDEDKLNVYYNTQIKEIKSQKNDAIDTNDDKGTQYKNNGQQDKSTQDEEFPLHETATATKKNEATPYKETTQDKIIENKKLSTEIDSFFDKDPHRMRINDKNLNIDCTRITQNNDETPSVPRENKETTKNKYEKITENVATITEQIQRSRSASRQNSLDNIANKLDLLIKTVNSLLKDMKMTDVPVSKSRPPKCTMSTCIARKNYKLSLDGSNKNLSNPNLCNLETTRGSDETTTIHKNTSAGNASTNNKTNISNTSLSNENTNCKSNDFKNLILNKNVSKIASSDRIIIESEISMTDTGISNDNQNNRKDSNKDKPDNYKSDRFVCVMTDRSANTCQIPRYNILIDHGVSTMDKIITEELNKSENAKRYINKMLERELNRPSGVQISFDIPTRDRSTEVTKSLSKAYDTADDIRQATQRVTIAVNTDPLTLMGLLKVSTETIRQLLSFVHFDYLSILPLSQLMISSAATNAQAEACYICNICGASFRRPSELSDHIEGHDLDSFRSCCVCRHFLASQTRCARVFTCQYCGQCFARAYCCELHQRSCARRCGARCGSSEGLALLR